MKDAQCVQANEEVNNEVAEIDEQHQDVNALKDYNQKNHVET